MLEVEEDRVCKSGQRDCRLTTARGRSCSVCWLCFTLAYFFSFSKSPCMCHIAHRCMKPASRDHFSAKIAFIYNKGWSFWTGLLYFTFSIGPNQPLMAIVLAYDCTAWRGELP